MDLKCVCSGFVKENLGKEEKRKKEEKKREGREDNVVPKKDHYHLISINMTFSFLLP